MRLIFLINTKVNVPKCFLVRNLAILICTISILILSIGAPSTLKCGRRRPVDAMGLRGGRKDGPEWNQGADARFTAVTAPLKMGQKPKRAGHPASFINFDRIQKPDRIYLAKMDNTETFFTEIRNGDLVAVARMISEHAEWVNAKDQRGSTPLILAAYYGHGDMVDLLLDKGARIDEKDSSGNTALMGVCFKGFTALAKNLIEKGANVNEHSAMGATCLIYAATFNRVEIAELLIGHGADTSAKDGRGNTALEHARMQGTPELIQLLEAQN